VRVSFLDALRGLAVVWMLIFHFTYDLRMFGFNSINFGQGFWFAFPRVIAFTFLFCVGVSLNFVHQGKINWNSLGKRSFKLAAASLCISVATYFIYPDQWVYFGTLHCILVGSILGALCVNHRIFSALFMIMILCGQYILGYDIKWVSKVLERPSMDFIPIYPWFWAILLGILTGPGLSKNRHLQQIKNIGFLKTLGTHSLKIYLIHQPLFFGLLWIVKTYLA